MTKKPEDEAAELERLLGEGDEHAEVKLHPFLSNEDVAVAKAAARKAIERERRDVAMRAVEEAEKQRLRVEEGLVTGDGVADEMVTIVMDLAPYTDKVSINGSFGKHYWTGHTYTVPRHVADTLSEMMFRSWRQEDQKDGKDLYSTYRRHLDTKINKIGKVENAPVRPA